MTQTFSNDLLMMGIKILDIGYITVLYIMFSIGFAYVTDKVMGKFDEKKQRNKSDVRLTVELICEMWVYGVFIYIVRNLVGLIPFPLDGYNGFEHRRVKELTNTSVFTFTYIFFSDYLKTKLTYFYNRVILFIENR
jgi:hypothetical protein